MVTVRKNMRYRVVRMGEKLRVDQQDELVAQLVRKETGKVVGYCNSRKRVDRLVTSGLFECDGFYGSIGGISNRRDTSGSSDECVRG